MIDNFLDLFFEQLYLNKYICVEDWLNNQKGLDKNLRIQFEEFINKYFSQSDYLSEDYSYIFSIYSKYNQLQEETSELETHISNSIDHLISAHPYLKKLQIMNASKTLKNKKDINRYPLKEFDEISYKNTKLEDFIEQLNKLKKDVNFSTNIDINDRIEFHNLIEKYSINSLIDKYQRSIHNLRKCTAQLICLTTYTKKTVNLTFDDIFQDEANKENISKTYIFSSYSEKIFIVRDFLTYQKLIKHLLNIELTESDIRITDLNKLHKILNQLDSYSNTLVQSNFLETEFEHKYGFNHENTELHILLLDFINLINNLNTDKNNNDTVFYRGHSNSNYTLTPSISRNEKLINNENKLYHETIIRCNEFFQHSRNNLEILTLMQHYAIPTRLLDITSNPLTALYFTVSDNLNLDGEVVVFSINSNSLKYYHSDTVEILATLSVMNSKEKEELNRALSTHIKQFILNLNKLIKNGISINYEILKDELSKTIEIFNSLYVVKKLVHEIGKKGAQFQGTINPFHLFNSYFVLPIMNNNRITRQSGAFIITGLLNKDDSHTNLYNHKFKLKNNYGGYYRDLSEDFNNEMLITVDRTNISKKFFKDVQNKLPSFKLIFEKEYNRLFNHRDRDENLRIIIPAHVKLEIQKWLDTFDINRATIYPEIEKVAQHLVDKYSSK